jgi:hypothetical protein
MNRRHGTHVILGAITPAYDAADADTLSYPYLRAAMKAQNLPTFMFRQGGELWRKRSQFSPAAMQEEWRSTYLLSVAYRLQKSWSLPEKVFWSSQFTTTSVKLFGRPLSREVSSIAARELEYFKDIARTFDIDESFSQKVTDAYRTLISSRATPVLPLEERYETILTQIRERLHENYKECFEVFDPYAPNFPLRAHEIAVLFRCALRELKTSNSSWNNWEVVMDNSAKLSVNVLREQIVVGRKRAPLLISEAKGLFVHEVLVHAKRAVSGAKHCHELTVGLPDYLVAEEGLGVLFESAIHGAVPTKVKDRYVDIALALGSWSRRPFHRNELYVFCFSRAVMRSVACGDALDLDELERVTWEHVNRIYRGSLGNKYIAVFTKDVTYYKGFIKMANYLQKSAEKGQLSEALQFVFQGKFDPTNKDHRQFVRELPVLKR